MLVSVIGNRGSGKTLFLTYIATITKRNVLSNFKIHIDKYIELTLIDLLDLPNDVNVFIDEGYTWLESRTSNSTLNRYLSYVVLQSRKRAIDIYITAQMFSSVDIRFRQQSDVLIKCKRVDKGFQYTFLDVAHRIIKSFILPYDKAKKYFSLYDTYQIIEPHRKKYLEFKLIESDGDKLNEVIPEIAEQIRPLMKKCTHDSVKKALIDEKIEIGYHKYVYPYLKEIFNIVDD